MTKEQIDIINQSINNLKLLCKGRTCNDCPMQANCVGYPDDWEEVDYD